MGLFDDLLNVVSKEISSTARKELNNAAKGAFNAAAKALNTKTETFTFRSLPASLTELQALPESTLDTPYKTAALAILALVNYNKNLDATIEMMDFLKGPANVSPYEKQFYRDRLAGKDYKMLSFFEGATVENGYNPSNPYTIKISSNPYSQSEENWITLYVKSAGADSPFQIKLRKKPSTGQWFVNDMLCLGDIRVPAEQDPWA